MIGTSMSLNKEQAQSDSMLMKRPLVLDRAEINEILNDTNQSPANGPLGMEKLIHGGLVSYERLPMLEVVCERLVRILATNLRSLTQDTVDVTLKAVKSRRFGECLEEAQKPAMFSIFEVKEWENSGIVIVEPKMIYNIIDVMMGGKQEVKEHCERYNFTSIERSLVERFVRIILSDLKSSFAPICEASFQFSRIETDPRFAMVARVSSGSIFIQINITIANRQGFVNIVLPYATIEPVREILLQQYMGEKFGRDAIWEAHLAEELRYTDVDLEAVLDEQVISLGFLMKMKAGTVIPLKIHHDSSITISCGGIALFEARPINQSGRIAAIIQKISPKTST
jgi:flagellar motor switch protein FliM